MDGRLVVLSFDPVFARLLLLAVFAVVAFTQETTLRPNLRTGDEFSLEMIRTRDDPRRGSLSGKSRTPVAVRVLEVTSNGLLLDWQFGATQFDNPNVLKNPVAAAAVNAFKDIRFEVILNSEGQYQGLRNEAEVSKKLAGLTEALLAAISRQIANPQTRKALEASAPAMMAPKTLLSSATRDIQTYFDLYGTSLTPGQSVEKATQRSSPLGSGAIPANVRLTLEKVAESSLSLSTTTTYDPASLQELTIKMIEQTGRTVSPAERAKMPDMQVIDEGKCIFDPSFGLMREVAINRVSSRADGYKRLDSWQIRLLNAPAR